MIGMLTEKNCGLKRGWICLTGPGKKEANQRIPISIIIM